MTSYKGDTKWICKVAAFPKPIFIQFSISAPQTSPPPPSTPTATTELPVSLPTLFPFQVLS